MSKYTAVLVLPLLLVTLTGCGEQSTNTPTISVTPNQVQEAPELKVVIPEDLPEPERDESGAIFSDPENLEKRAKYLAPEI